MGNQASQNVVLGKMIPNDTQVEWKRVTNPFPWPAREGHVGCEADGALYVFGGVIQGEHGEIIETNELLRFDLGKSSWQRVEAKGQLPAPRAGASLVAVGRQLYLWGGLSCDEGWMAGMYCFDLDSGRWSKMEEKGILPKPRDKLQAVAIDSKIYYFGGFGAKVVPDDTDDEEDEDDDEEHELEGCDDNDGGALFGWFNDLFVFDTETKVWTQPMQMNLGVPTARAAHSMCAVGKNIVIFGGRDAKTRQNDIHIFNTETRKWRMDMMVEGQFPTPRSFHTAVAVGSRVVVLGGRDRNDRSLADLHIFDTETCSWLQPAVTGALPCGRDQHTAAVVGDCLLLFGGTTDYNEETLSCQTHLSDTFLAKTEDLICGGPIATKEKVESSACS